MTRMTSSAGAALVLLFGVGTAWANQDEPPPPIVVVQPPDVVVQPPDVVVQPPDVVVQPPDVVVLEQPEPERAPRLQVTDSEYDTHPNGTLLATGFVTFGVGYGAAVLVAGTSDHQGDNHLYVPIIGPWLESRGSRLLRHRLVSVRRRDDQQGAHRR